MAKLNSFVGGDIKEPKREAEIKAAIDLIKEMGYNVEIQKLPGAANTKNPWVTVYASMAVPPSKLSGREYPIKHKHDFPESDIVEELINFADTLSGICKYDLDEASRRRNQQNQELC